MNYANKIVQKCKKAAIFAEESLYILHVTAADAFPCAVVEEEDIVAIDAGDLVAVLIHGIPPCALFDTEIAVSEHLRNLIGIGFYFASRTMVDVPVAGRALHGHIAKRIVPDFLAVDAADEVAVFVREVPCVAATDAVIAVVEHVDLIAVEDGIATTVDINLPAGEADLTAVAQVLVVLGAILRFAGGHLVVGVLEPEVVLVRHDILRGEREACHQGEAKGKQFGSHKAMILRVIHFAFIRTNIMPYL